MKTEETNIETFSPLIRLVLSTLTLGIVMYVVAFESAHSDIIHPTIIRLTLPFLGSYLALIFIGKIVIEKNSMQMLFLSLLGVYILLLLAYPVVRYYRPELLWDKELGGELGTLFYIIPIIAALSLFIVFIVNYFRSDSYPTLESNFPVHKIDPEKASTLKEIQELPKAKTVPFRYGEADKGLIDRFYAIYYKLRHRKQKLDPAERKIVFSSVGAIVFLLLWCIVLPLIFITPEREVERDRERVTSCIVNRPHAIHTTTLAASLKRLVKHYNEKQMIQGKTISEVKEMFGLKHNLTYPINTKSDGVKYVTLINTSIHGYLDTAVYCFLDENQHCTKLVYTKKPAYYF